MWRISGVISRMVSDVPRMGMRMGWAAYMAAVEATTRDQVVAAARSLTLHTTYFLKGGSQ